MSDLLKQFADLLESDWRSKARPEQLPPPGDWSLWIACAGRGWGKTRCGAEWVLEIARANPNARIALIAPTAADARDVMVEGPSGIISIAPKDFVPLYEPSKRRVTFPNGAYALTFSSQEPERLRGPQFSDAWCDEFAAWQNLKETWDQLQFGLRVGKHPRTLITTTPKPLRLLRELMSRPDAVVARGKTLDNADNLPAATLANLIARYQGTRLGRQELNAEILEDAEGSLWRREWIEQCRVDKVPDDLQRIVVAIDPAVSVSEDSDETGIIVAGVDFDGHGFVLEDISGKFEPHEWAAHAIGAYHRWRADLIVAEANQGGAMVESTIRMVDANVPVRLVHATRGKAVRAEPISALYEQGRIHHVGIFEKLEDQLLSFSQENQRSRGDSPDHADSLVWAFTELIVDNGTPGILLYYQEELKRQGITTFDPDTGPVFHFDDPDGSNIPMICPSSFTGGCIIGKSGKRYQGMQPGDAVDIDLEDQLQFRRLGWTEMNEADLEAGNARGEQIENSFRGYWPRRNNIF